MLNKLNDLHAVSELYRKEIKRTQQMNREMLINYDRIKFELDDYRQTTQD